MRMPEFMLQENLQILENYGVSATPHGHGRWVEAERTRRRVDFFSIMADVFYGRLCLI